MGSGGMYSPGSERRKGTEVGEKKNRWMCEQLHMAKEWCVSVCREGFLVRSMSQYYKGLCMA